MRLFKRKAVTIGKGTEDIVTLRRELPALNLMPVDYRYSYAYSRFLEQAESRFMKIIEKTDIDDLCDDMLDCYIDSIVTEAKASAKTQYTNHMYAIENITSLLHGQYIEAQHHLSNLQADLTELENERAFIKQLQKDRDIY